MNLERSEKSSLTSILSTEAFNATDKNNKVIHKKEKCVMYEELKTIYL